MAGRPSDIVIISRDRHGPYAKAVRRGARQAAQVADRFHLVFNLRGAVQQELSRLRPFLGVSYEPAAVATTGSDAVVVAPPRRRSRVVDHQHRVLQERRTLQLERFQLVKRLPAAGRTGQAVTSETGIGRSTVRKWMRCTELPTRHRMAPRVGIGRDYACP